MDFREGLIASLQTIDSKGLITADRKGLQDHKKCELVLEYLSFHDFLKIRRYLAVFARTDYHGPPLTSLIDIIEFVQPTALMGLSTIPVCG